MNKQAPASQTQSVQCWITPPSPCSYLAGQMASSLIANPDGPMDTGLYGQLAQLGFRRSGRMVYRPQCQACSQCQSVRIPIDAWRARRTDRRCLKANLDLDIHFQRAVFDEEHYQLYLRYCAARHPGSEMDGMDRERYQGFLWSPWSDTQFIEARLDGELLLVAVFDVLETGLSAVYSFFEPSHAQRALGRWAILQQIKETHRRELPYLYLGYWIADSPKMAYKAEYRPLQHFVNNRWQALDPVPQAPGQA